mgnify:CR=1 FL=1
MISLIDSVSHIFTPPTPPPSVLLEIRVIIEILKNPCYAVNIGLVELVDANGIGLAQFAWS